ncbi:hypothetical protein PU634_10490 [Oceanimonas pelagia]|uniref:Uncharacterized protein n=1 Tax=Oceanimonas pelagia TaxID=3028314 RepID=A0AA50KLB5_9GAMM|nr:hypothetical protein [Oceanimonas pelagia]WMC09544.1 hypothetical protein PU634_10490 [Oceanimonas pelagia]
MTVLDHDLNKKVTIRICPDHDAESPRSWDNFATMACWHRSYNLGDEGGQEYFFDVLHDALTAIMKHRRAASVREGYTAYDSELACPRCSHLGRYGGDNCATCEGWGVVPNPFYLDKEDPGQALAIYQEYEHLVPYEMRLIYLPLYLYDHSGITMSTGSFGCPWDSGQVGWIFVTYREVLESWTDWKRITPARAEKVGDYLRAEVEVYDLYLTGNVWGFEAYEHDEDEDPEDGVFLDSCWGFYGDPDEPNENGMAGHWPDEWLTADREVSWH